MSGRQVFISYAGMTESGCILCLVHTHTQVCMELAVWGVERMPRPPQPTARLAAAMVGGVLTTGRTEGLVATTPIGGPSER